MSMAATVKGHARAVRPFAGVTGRTRVWPLFLLALVGLVLPLLAPAGVLSRAETEGALAAGLRDGDVAKAEKVLTRLSSMRLALGEGAGSGQPARLYTRYYPGLFVTVAELRDSELKTELDTAVFLYERLVRPDALPDAPADCAGERPDTYRPLCENLPGATARQMLWVKAGLHARWAEALVRLHRGAPDSKTRGLLKRLSAARESDVEIGRRALEGCVSAGQLLSSHPLVGAVGGRRKNAYDSGADTRGEAARALSEAKGLASSLPRSPFWYRLSNALSAYEDGLFWLGRLEQSTSRVVSARGPAAVELKEIGVPEEVAGATVRGNFRQAHLYAATAAELLRELQTRHSPCCRGGF